MTAYLNCDECKNCVLLKVLLHIVLGALHGVTFTYCRQLMSGNPRTARCDCVCVMGAVSSTTAHSSFVRCMQSTFRNVCSLCCVGCSSILTVCNSTANLYAIPTKDCIQLCYELHTALP